MTIKIKRKIQYDNRVALQQADQAIRKDVIRAIVELITNCNDSYQRMDDKGLVHNGLIVIEVQRRHQNSILYVRDFAEGMGSDKMDKTVGTYGAATSGFIDGKSVRGFWGRGLKDSIFGLGHGRVSSIYEDVLNQCSLLIEKGTPTFKLDKSIKATRIVRKQLNITSGNGSVIEIVKSREDVRVPQFDNIRRNLERHFELRTIMANPQRKLVLRELDSHNKLKDESILQYPPPVGTLILDEVFYLPSTKVEVHLEVFRSDVALSTPAEAGHFADGGFLVISKHVVFDLTLLKFENNEYASRFYGRITCNYLHDLLKKEPPEPVLTATRDGISWGHDFTKSLKLAVEAKLEPLIEEEKRRIQAERQIVINKKLQERLDIALKELNSIANLELGKIGDGEDNVRGKKVPFVPAGGFGFVPDYVYVQTGKPATLILRAQISEKIVHGSLVTIESDNSEVNIISSQALIEQRTDYPEIGEACIQIEGRQVGAEAIITAEIDALKTEALIKVISKRVPPINPRPPQGRGALIRGFKFDPSAEPRQRVKFDRANSLVIISTEAPSVAAYFDELGNGQETPQGQVLLAELITEAACREMARRGVESGKYLTMPGTEIDSIQREYINLQNKYAHKIHAFLVDPNYRRNSDVVEKKAGRPKREETMSMVVSEA